MENKGHSKLKTGGQPSLNYFISPAANKLDRDTYKSNIVVSNPIQNTFKIETKSFETTCKLLFTKLSEIEFIDSQILIYQKGHKDALVYQKSHSIFQINAENFNAVYNSVKRSKIKIFDNKKFKSSHFHGSGPIIANEFDYLNTQIVFIASRSEFFPPLQSEKNQFNLICKEAHGPLIKSFLLESNIDRLEIIRTALVSNSEPFKINNKSGEIWLEKNYSQQENTNPSLFYLKENYLLTIFNKTLSEINPTLFHYERISLLGELLNTLRHELCNPLFGIQLYLTLWDESINNAEQKELLQHALKCVNKCNNIILNLDSLFRNNSPREELDIKKFLDDILTIAKSEVRNIPTVILVEQSPTCLIKAHGLSLFHILFNFIINAAQSIKQNSDPLAKHEIKISVASVNNILSINVADTGVGISQTDFNKISSPFYSTKVTGHGIGLNICKMLAEKMGGKITFKNRDDRLGAIFSLELNL
jgi:signal transduction histidine kinase